MNSQKPTLADMREPMLLAAEAKKWLRVIGLDSTDPEYRTARQHLIKALERRDKRNRALQLASDELIRAADGGDMRRVRDIAELLPTLREDRRAEIMGIVLLAKSRSDRAKEKEADSRRGRSNQKAQRRGKLPSVQELKRELIYIMLEQSASKGEAKDILRRLRYAGKASPQALNKKLAKI